MPSPGQTINAIGVIANTLQDMVAHALALQTDTTISNSTKTSAIADYKAKLQAVAADLTTLANSL